VVDNDSIHSYEHRRSQDAAEVLWVSYLIKEEIKLPMLLIHSAKAVDISDFLDLNII
jgi:hypothetical protein